MMMFGALTSTLIVNGSVLTVALAYYRRAILKFDSVTDEIIRSSVSKQGYAVKLSQ
jgi:hypothetical protein